VWSRSFASFSFLFFFEKNKHAAHRTQHTAHTARAAMICLFCRGKGCKYENYENWLHTRNTHNAIEGVFSNWITDEVLAMARPSTRTLREYDIIGQFRAAGVGAVFNLQQPGEHRRCGDGVTDADGFSYAPDEFTSQGIAFHNLGWRDMSAPTCEAMLDIVQLVAGAIVRCGKVAIHCHAGLGRTGLVAAAYLVLEHRLSPHDAIAHVRLRRPGSLQNKSQEQFLHDFARYVQELAVVFPSASAEDLLRRQRLILHGDEYREFHDVPKCAAVLCRRISQLAGERLPHLDARGFVPTRHALPSLMEGRERQQDRELLQRITELQQLANYRVWGAIVAIDDPHVLLCLLAEWLACLQQPVLPATAVEAVFSQQQGDRPFEEVLRSAVPGGSSFAVFMQVVGLLNERSADDLTFRQMLVLLAPSLLQNRMLQDEAVRRSKRIGQIFGSPHS
jgi:hypothetical protein